MPQDAHLPIRQEIALREWMGVDEETFYNPDILAITPMGFCFPGLDAKGGDLPPRKECATRWQEEVTTSMPQVRLVLLIGMYAQKHYLGPLASKTLTETVRNWQTISQMEGGRIYLPLPHPSWRNNGWIRKNPWFASELLPFPSQRNQCTFVKNSAIICASARFFVKIEKMVSFFGNL